MANKFIGIGITLPPEMVKRLDDISDARIGKPSRSALIREAIETCFFANSVQSSERSVYRNQERPTNA